MAVVLTVFLAGCTAMAPRPAEEIVAERALKRLELLMAGEFEASYALTSPGYRSVASLQQYQLANAGNGMWKSAQINSVECDGPEPVRCEVQAAVVYAPVGMGIEYPRPINETWILVRGDWYKFLE